MTESIASGYQTSIRSDR